MKKAENEKSSKPAAAVTPPGKGKAVTPPSGKVKRYVVEHREVHATYESAKRRAAELEPGGTQDARVRVRRRRDGGKFHVVVKTPRYVDEKPTTTSNRDRELGSGHAILDAQEAA